MLHRAQNLPENQRRLILFALVSLIAVGALIVFINRTKNSLSQFRTERILQELKTQELQEQTQKSLEQINFPLQGQSEQIKKTLEEAEQIIKDSGKEIEQEKQ